MNRIHWLLGGLKSNDFKPLFAFIFTLIPQIIPFLLHEKTCLIRKA